MRMPATIAALAQNDEVGAQAALRAFELVLLREIGLLPDLGLETAIASAGCAPNERYLVLADAGVVETESDSENAATIGGATLAALEMALAADLRLAPARRCGRARRAAAAPARTASLSSRHIATCAPGKS